MADKKEAPAEAGAEATAPAGPKLIMGMPLPVFGLIALNVLVMIAGLFMIINIKLLHKQPVITESQVETEIAKTAKAADKNKEPAEVYVVDYQPMTINLRSQVGGRTHYATLAVSLECSNEDCMSELESESAKIKDQIHSLISSKSYLELNKVNIKMQIKHEIAVYANTVISEGTVTNTYFTKFVIQ